MNFQRFKSGRIAAGLLLAVGALSAVQVINAQAPAAPVQNNSDALKALAERFQRQHAADEAAVADYLKANPGESRTRVIDGKVHTLIRIDDKGQPVYRVHRDAGPSGKAVRPRQNIQSAALIKADSLYPGGSLGVNITGQNMVAGVWEPGLPRTDHELLAGKSAIEADQGAPTDDTSEDNVGNRNHATHVTGTMIGRDFTTDETKPADPNGTGARTARGIAHGATARNWDAQNDLAEMALAAADANAPIRISNHSYGDANTRTDLWFYGAYNDEAQNWDALLKNAPMYLPFIAGGNEQESSGNREAKQGYDIITGSSAAKNPMTVGSVNADKTMSSYSNWGPTDDGRVKPEIVARGTGINSAQAFDTSPAPSTTAYSGSSDDSSGTSYAAPAAAAGALLLQQYYASLNSGAYMRASTLKTLIMGTAEDLGQPGPDYKFGYGLMNVEAAANAIKKNSITISGTNCTRAVATGFSCSLSAANSKGALIYEWNADQNRRSTSAATIDDGVVNGELNFQVIAKGGAPLVVNLGWTDDEFAAAQVEADGVDPTTNRMVYNYDIMVRTGSAGNETFSRPWVLPGMMNRTSSAARATAFFEANGGPFRQVIVDTPTAGASYQIFVRKLDSSPRAQRTLSLVVTGLAEPAQLSAGTCNTTTTAKATSSAPSADLCSTGTAGSVTSSGGQWTWSCNGSGGGANASCTAPFQTQSITLNANPTSVVIDSTSTVTATSTSGQLPVVTTSTGSVCSLVDAAGAPLTTTKTTTGLAAGTCTVKANVAASANGCTSCFQAASEASTNITVTKKSQTISFGAAPMLVVGGTGTLSAQALPSMLAVSFAASGMQTACSVSGSTVTALAAGECTVVANQAGDAVYLAADQVSQTFTIGQGGQSITNFTANPSSLSFGATATLSAAGGASGQPVTFGADSSVCTVDGNTVTPTGIGTCTVVANQQGNANYTAAPQQSLDITIGKGSQTITFGTAPANVTVGGTGTASATASSGRSVTITSDTPNVCTISQVAELRSTAIRVKESSSVTVTGVALGVCTLRATRAADDFYNAATDVTQSFGIADGSGVPPPTQDQVPDADGTGTGDGNGDGTADSQQNNVVSLPSVATGTPYLTLAAPDGTTLSNVSSVAAPDDLPAGTTAPFAGLAFTLSGVATGATVSVEVFFPFNTAINGVMKRNRVTGQLERVAGATVRQIGTVKTAVSYNIVDGGPYDTDGVANGVIVDPVFPSVTPTPSGGNGGSLGGLLLLPLALLALLRRRKLH